MTELRCVQVSKWFDSHMILDKVDLTIGPGLHGLLGPNGAGKSTLISILSGHLAPSSGDVLLDGEPLGADSSRWHRIGLLSDVESLPRGHTGRELVADVARCHGLGSDRAQETLDELGIAHVADQDVATYSTGTRRRLRLALALVHRPDVLLLDEPFNGLDPVERGRLAQTLRRRAEAGAAVIVSSHVLDELEALCSRIDMLVAGRVIASGPIASIRSRLDEVPTLVLLEASEPRAVASQLINHSQVKGCTVTGERTLQVAVHDLSAFARVLPGALVGAGSHLDRLELIDHDLGSVFRYLMQRSVGGRR